MRHHKILTRTLLILSIINFAFTAPVAVRGGPEVRLDANVLGKVTSASQKRQDSLDKRGSSTNVTGPDNARPPSPLTEVYSPLNPELFSSEYWDNVLKELRLPVGSMPVAGSLSPPTPPSPHSSQPGPSEGHFPSPSGVSVNPDRLSAAGSTVNHPIQPQSPGLDPEMHSLLNPEPFRTDFWVKVLKGKFERRISGSDAVNLARKDTRSRNF